MNLDNLKPYLSNWKTYVGLVVTVALVVNASSHTVTPEVAATIVSALAALGVVLHVKADGTPDNTTNTPPLA